MVAAGRSETARFDRIGARRGIDALDSAGIAPPPTGLASFQLAVGRFRFHVLAWRPVEQQPTGAGQHGDREPTLLVGALHHLPAGQDVGGRLGIVCFLGKVLDRGSGDRRPAAGRDDRAPHQHAARQLDIQLLHAVAGLPDDGTGEEGSLSRQVGRAGGRIGGGAETGARPGIDAVMARGVGLPGDRGHRADLILASPNFQPGTRDRQAGIVVRHHSLEPLGRRERQGDFFARLDVFGRPEIRHFAFATRVGRAGDKHDILRRKAIGCVDTEKHLVVGRDAGKRKPPVGVGNDRPEPGGGNRIAAREEVVDVPWAGEKVVAGLARDRPDIQPHAGGRLPLDTDEAAAYQFLGRKRERCFGGCRSKLSCCQTSA